MATEEMKCDICTRADLYEVIILRKEKFTIKANKLEKIARRVCWDCATILFNQKKYDFGNFWKKLFFYIDIDNKTKRTLKNYKKYVEVIQ